MSNTATAYVGSGYEVELSAGGSAMTRTTYYSALTARVMRVVTDTTPGLVYYTLTDHLGSASVTLDSGGEVVGQMRYYAFGETRVATGSMWTDKLFTGQRQHSYTELILMGSRFYDPALARWIQPDSIVPEPRNPQALNRYSYVLNRPLLYIDPTGHVPDPKCKGNKIPDCGVNDPTTPKSPKTPTPYTPPLPKDSPLTDAEIIAVIVYAETSNGSQPHEVKRRLAWVAFNKIANDASYSHDAFLVIDNGWAGTRGQAPTWDELLVNFVYDSSSMKHTLYNPDTCPTCTEWQSVNNLTDETKLAALTYAAKTAYKNEGGFTEIMGIATSILNQVDAEDPTKGATNFVHLGPGGDPGQNAARAVSTYGWRGPGESYVVNDHTSGRDWFGLVLYTYIWINR